MRYLRPTADCTVLDLKRNVDINGKGKAIPVTGRGDP
jgi:hypothetical protein